MVETNGKGRSRRRVKQSIGQRIAERMHTESRRWAAVCLIIAMVSGNCGNSLFPAWAATEEKETYVVSYMVDPLGAAEVIGKEEVTEGSDLKFTIVPEDGCVVEEVWVNGENYLERDPEEVELATDSDATPSDAKATASDWEETDGSYTFLVPSVDCDIDVEIHMTGWDEVWYDTKIYTEKIGDALIRADVKDGTFGEEVTMVAVRLEQDSDAYTEVGEKMEAEGYDVVAYDAFDITFINEQGDEVEPSKPVSVSVEYEQTWKPEEAENVATEMKVLHLHEDRLAELGDAKIQENENGELEKVSVDMDEFSVVTVAAIRSVELPVQMKGSRAVPEDWAKSKSKAATKLDENLRSQVTLSLPSAEEKLVSDVVFVLDKSTSVDVKDEAIEMLEDLKNQVKQVHAKVNVGVVIFNNQANRVFELADLADNYDDIVAAINQTFSDGTNIHAGLLAAQAMLDEDDSVAEKRKYMILVSDGISYLYNNADSEPTTIALSNNEVSAFGGPDNWITKYRDVNYEPDDWETWLDGIGKLIEKDGTRYEYRFVPKKNPSIGDLNDYIRYSEKDSHAMAIEKAFYLTDQVYQDMVQSGYHCYVLKAESNSAASYPYGPKFMDYLANGEEVSFKDIQNDIYYLVDAGSTVEDYMGFDTYQGYSYDFDFVPEKDLLHLTVGVGEQKDTLEVTEIEAGRKFAFGESGEGTDAEGQPTYPFVLEYVPGEGGEEHFVWHINRAISNFEKVQLTYTVQLTNPTSTVGTYGTNDEYGDNNNGVEGEAGLYTNSSATLYPVDSDGTGLDPEEFQKPTVALVVESTGPIEKPFEWQTDKSKFATELDKNTLQSKVTLALPSGEKELVSDVVFVWDKSDCAEAVAEEAAVLVSDLLDSVEANNAKIKVGAVVFGGKAVTTFDLQELTADKIEELQNAVAIRPADVGSGTNIQAGLLAADEMLSADTEVSNTRKYVILVTDGVTQVFTGSDGKTKAIYHVYQSDWKMVGCGPTAWSVTHGYGDWGSDVEVPGGSWNAFYAEIKEKVEKDIQAGDLYTTDFVSDPLCRLDQVPDDINVIPLDEVNDHALSMDRAYYEAYNTYLDLAKKYHCNAVVVNDTPLGVAFVDAVNNGKKVNFDTIQKEILYLVDAGSYIEDYIGFDTYNGYSYDFDFINKADAISLTVGGEKLPITPISETEYGFGAPDAGRTADGDPTYPFILEYHPGEKKADEHFIWRINTAISNFAQVRLEYTVQLMNPPETAGTYGIYDGYGVGNKGGAGEAGLYTNTRATLYPVDSEGNQYEAEDFKKPTVVYTVEKSEEPTDPDPDPDPDTPTDPDPDTPTDPDPDTPTDPDPDTPSRPNGSNGGGGGGGGSRTPGTDTTGGPGTVTIVSEGVPLASAPELVEIPAEEVPLSALPKTGRESRNAVLLMISSMALAAYLFLQKKRDQENQ